jgi:hypothetical protein
VRVNKTACLTAIALLFALFSLATFTRPAFAQAGSAGGSVGKQDKSLSGGDDREPAQSKAPHKPARSMAEKSSKEKSGRPAAGCSIAGNYSYAFQTVTVFTSGGTASNSAGPQGTWSCSGGRITVNWNTGYVDRLIPSGGSSYSASNNHGWTWSARRM